MRQIPQFIEENGVPGISTKYAWEKFSFSEHVPSMTAVMNETSGMMPSAKFAFGLGVAEWVYGRASTLGKDPAAGTILDEAWKYNQGPDGFSFHDLHILLDESKRRDPLEGPLYALGKLVLSLMAAEKARRTSPDTSWGGPARAIYPLVRLARFMIPGGKPRKAFDAWYQDTLKKLHEKYRATRKQESSAEFGPAVLREEIF